MQTITPASLSAFIFALYGSFSAALSASVQLPRDIFATRTFTPAAFAANTKSIARIWSLVSEPVAYSTLPSSSSSMNAEKTGTAISFTFCATPAMPVSLSVTAPMMPATCVPCPSTSPTYLESDVTENTSSIDASFVVPAPGPTGMGSKADVTGASSSFSPNSALL